MEKIYLVFTSEFKRRSVIAFAIMWTIWPQPFYTGNTSVEGRRVCVYVYVYMCQYLHSCSADSVPYKAEGFEADPHVVWGPTHACMLLTLDYRFVTAIYCHYLNSIFEELKHFYHWINSSFIEELNLG